MAQPSVFERIASGEDDAVRECMQRYGSVVWSLARRWTESAADAEDAAQEVFMELWKCAARFDPAAGSEAAFVRTIARRRLIDRLRASRRRPPNEALDENAADSAAEDITDAVDKGARLEVAQRALAGLDAGQREVLLMGIVEGMTHAEIADATGKPLGTVKTQIRRGLIKLRRMLEADVPESPDAPE